MFGPLISEQEKQRLLTGEKRELPPTQPEPPSYTYNVFNNHNRSGSFIGLGSSPSGGISIARPSGGSVPQRSQSVLTLPPQQKQQQYAVRTVKPVPMMNKDLDTKTSYPIPLQQQLVIYPSNQPQPIRPSSEELAHPNQHIRVMFMHQSAFSRTNIWNRLIQICTRNDLIHCEINFPVTNETLSVDGANPVFLERNKNYSYEDWEMYSVEVTAEQYNTMYEWGKTQRGKPFDMNAFRCYLCSGMCTTPGTELKAWLCSRLTIAVLKRGGVLPAYVNEFTVSPGTLQFLLTRMNAEGTLRLQHIQFEVKKHE